MSSQVKPSRKLAGKTTKMPSVTSQTSGEELSADDMRNVLYERLHNKGLLDTLKSQLRDHMVAELRGKTINPRVRTAGRGLEQRLLDSLIYKYLCDIGCDYTVGVFLPEAGITKREILHNEEMRKLLCLPHVGADDSLLQSAITRVMSAQGADKVTDSCVQTDSHTLLLTDKLSHIDTEFSARMKPKSTSTSVEERLLSHQRKIELACSQKSQQDLERWKKLEMETIQITEREKVQRELQDRRRQLEEEYRKKVQAITDRERALTDSVKVEYETVQRETFNQRQQLLQQSDQLRHRETEIREERSHLARLQRANEEKIEKLEKMLKKREAEIEKKELNMDNTLRNQQQRCKLEEQLSYESRHRELKAWEEKLKDKESSLEREKRSMLTNSERKELLDLRLSKQELGKQVNKYSLEISGLEMGMTALQERLAKMFDYEVLRESNISLKKDLEMTKERLDCLNKEHHFLQEKYEHMMIDGKEKAGVGEIMLIKTQIQKERDKALDEKVLLEHRLKEMDAKFNEQIRKNQALMREFELQTDRQKYMNKEYCELRKQMGDSNMDSAIRSKHNMSANKDPSYFDTSFRRSIPPEIALEPDWLADISSGAEVSTATEESIVTETRKRLNNLTEEAENLHSAFRSITRQSAAPVSTFLSPTKPAKTAPSRNQTILHSAVDMPMTSQYLSSLPVEPVQPAQPAEHAYPVHQYQITTDRDVSMPPVAAVTRGSLHNVYTFSAADSWSQADQFNRPTPNKPTSREFTADLQPIRSPLSSPPTKHTASPEGKGFDSRAQIQGEYDAPFARADVDTPIGANKSPAPFVPADVAQPASLDSLWQPEPQRQSAPTPVVATPTPLDAPTSSLNVPPTSLGAPPTPVDATPTSLDAQWKAKPASVVTQPKTNEQTSVSAAAATAESSKPKEDSLAGIDPVMQKYMQMVQQQKQAEKTNSKPAEAKVDKVAVAGADEVSSVSEHISLAKSDNGGGATDDDFW